MVARLCREEALVHFECLLIFLGRLGRAAHVVQAGSEIGKIPGHVGVVSFVNPLIHLQ